MWEQYFQVTSIPLNQITGSYDLRLVILSYLVATATSYIALDVTGCLRDAGNTKLTSILWLLGGAFAMGAGIWSMHFIGMLAFIMDMPHAYDPLWTSVSLLIAILASGFALFLLRASTVKVAHLVLGGIILGCAIASMHYVGMQAMKVSMNVRYQPDLFILSIVIAIIASEAAIYLALKSNEGTLKERIRLKVVSAFIMGGAICGMHYTGMIAAVFTPLNIPSHALHVLDPGVLSMSVAMVTLFVLGIAFAVSTYKSLMNNQVIHFARQAGMAEVAANVLHNVGNVLNSVNISATLIEEHLGKSELTGLTELSELLDNHKTDLSTFITSSQGSQLPDYLKLLATYWQNEQATLTTELNKLIDNIQHIKDIITIQQTLSGISNFEEVIAIEIIIEEALSITAIDFYRSNIKVEKNYEKLKPVLVDKIKVLQILINLIHNAKESLLHSAVENKLLIIKLALTPGDNFIIEISDNGEGIAEENLTRIFSHGFTTKKTGHGFGLHASVLAAKEMGGSLNAESDGLGKGATFILELPYKSVDENRKMVGSYALTV